MSFALMKNVFKRYSPVEDSDPLMLDAEKDGQIFRRASDLESDGNFSSDSSEKRSPNSRVDARLISDAIIGLSDGMTVPFALTAGLSALGSTKVVIFGGLAELIAGAISMGLGGYLGAKSEEESYKATRRETLDQIQTDPASVTTSISDIFESYDLPPPLTAELTNHLAASPKLLDFLMRFEHTQEEPSGSRALTCAFTIALGYFLGGFIPLLPYFFVASDSAILALCWSIGTMAVALFIFGYGKTCFVTGWNGSRNVKKGVIGGLQMVIVGGAAAGSAMGIVKAFQSLTGTEIS